MAHNEEFRQKLAGLLHVLFCGVPHEEDMLKLYEEGGKCSYYLEHTLTPRECWQSPSHMLWLKHADEFMVDVNEKSPELAFKLLSRLVRRRQELEELFQECEALRKWFKLLY